ncbi:hypothetical protein EYM_03560 [Ignicoccus islandicus DSM 13165]|uniref:ABC transporter permease n=1 Tax=Ignicoccus islandicus DSM 13165 TaxID=940295 RepID=A0A0U3FKR2_9CREN|nr:metal ABC transporter permease [Ignicoccus islandicus]ALU12422.1 hypothetical protein EYM_03560 [Ignicoccus islandicus DSM 13165]
MIAFIISIILTVLTTVVAEPSLVIASSSLSMLSPTVSCFIVCSESIGILFSSGLLGLMVSMVSSILQLSPYYTISILFLLSVVLSIFFVYAESKEKTEEASEIATIIITLIVVGVMLTNSEIAFEAFYQIMKDLTLVTFDEAVIYFAISSLLVIISMLIRDHIVSIIFDKEYVSVMSSMTFLRIAVAVFISVFGTSLTSYYLGLFTSQSLLVLPTLLAVRGLRRDLVDVVDITYIASMISLIIGIEISSFYNVPISGAAIIFLVLTIVLLDVGNSIGKYLYSLKGRPIERSNINSRENRK